MMMMGYCDPCLPHEYFGKRCRGQGRQRETATVWTSRSRESFVIDLLLDVMASQIPSSRPTAFTGKEQANILISTVWVLTSPPTYFCASSRNGFGDTATPASVYRVPSANKWVLTAHPPWLRIETQVRRHTVIAAAMPMFSCAVPHRSCKRVHRRRVPHLHCLTLVLYIQLDPCDGRNERQEDCYAEPQ